MCVLCWCFFWKILFYIINKWIGETWFWEIGCFLLWDVFVFVCLFFSFLLFLFCFVFVLILILFLFLFCFVLFCLFVILILFISIDQIIRKMNSNLLFSDTASFEDTKYIKSLKNQIFDQKLPFLGLKMRKKNIVFLAPPLMWKLYYNSSCLLYKCFLLNWTIWIFMLTIK